MQSLASWESTSPFWDVIFASSPQKSPSSTKSVWDHATTQLDSIEGSWDFYRVLQLVCSSLPQVNKSLERAAKVFDHIGMAFSLPKIVLDVTALKEAADQVSVANQTPYSDPLREKKMGCAYKELFLKGTTLGNTTSQGFMILHHLKLLVFSATRFFFVNVVFTTTCLILDGTDLISQFYKLKQCQQLCSTYPLTKVVTKPQETIQHKTHLACMTILQDCSSLGATLLPLTGMFPGAILPLGGVWLGLKIYCALYEKTFLT